MDQPNKPTLGGYLELLIKVMVSMILLIFVGIGTAIVVLAVPFFLSLMCILALLFLVGRTYTSGRYSF